MNSGIYVKCHGSGMGKVFDIERRERAGKMPMRQGLSRHVHHPYCSQKKI